MGSEGGNSTAKFSPAQMGIGSDAFNNFKETRPAEVSSDSNFGNSFFTQQITVAENKEAVLIIDGKSSFDKDLLYF